MNAQDLAFYPRRFKGEFIRMHNEVPVNHEFQLYGEPWVCVWCQRSGRVGWLAMVIRKSDLPAKEAE